MFRSTVLLCSLYFLALTPYLARAATEEQKAKIKEELEKLGAECMADFPITEDDINDFKSKKIPTGDGVPCFVACMMKKMGVLDEAGMMQKETALELAKSVFHDEEELKIIGDYLHSCASVGGRLANGGGSKDAGEPLLNGHVHITENPAKKFQFGRYIFVSNNVIIRRKSRPASHTQHPAGSLASRSACSI
ncbi:hypothetical protein evm_008378 [Chilo suppressalis]|nr:hypothetical protein evm_008378 [Chilo suppressalis]